MTGQSLAAASDAVTRNGKKNTAWGTFFVISGTLAVIGGGVWLRYFFEKKGNDSKLKNYISVENIKHKNRVDEAKLKNELKKEIIDYRKEQIKRESPFNSDTEVKGNDADESVETFDEIVSGEDIVADDLRLGLRCFHIGEDCGLIGRTQIGKTSWVLQYAIALAKGAQENDYRLTPDWKLDQQMKVLYFAFEQDRSFFKAKYGQLQKSIPNLHIEVKTSPNDFTAIARKIVIMQKNIGNHRLLVVFDNITKMKCGSSRDKRTFFEWLESYRKDCASSGQPITYLKVFHTQGHYKDYIPLDATTNYGAKTDTYFTQSLVGFGMCKGGNGRERYIKELKNKLEQNGEKQSLSVFRFADSEIPMYDYVGEADECDVLPSKPDIIRRSSRKKNGEMSNTKCSQGKRGRNEEYSHELLVEMCEEHKAGFSWREIMGCHSIAYDLNSKDGVNNKAKGIKQAMKRHGIR